MTALAVTFTEAGSLVGRVAHGWANGQALAFASIVGTTGIGTHVTYFVVNRTADAFQLAATAGGAVTVAPSGSFSVSDTAGNVQTTAGGTDRSVTYISDATPPTVTTKAHRSEHRLRSGRACRSPLDPV